MSRRTTLHTSLTHRFPPRPFVAGSMQLSLVVLLSLGFVVGGCYLYSVNRSSVQGYAMRTLEHEIQELKKENAALKVEEAEARSLSKVEAGSETLRMEKVTTTQVLSGRHTVALR